MGDYFFRALKVALICFAIAAGLIAALNIISVPIWCCVLLLATAIYWYLLSRDPWLSSKFLHKEARNISSIEKSRPDWFSPKRSVSSSGTSYLAIALLFLYASQFDHTKSITRGVLSTAVSSMLNPLFIQIVLILIGTLEFNPSMQHWPQV